MDITYRRAVLSDVELLAHRRVELIDEDSGLDENEKKSLYENNRDFMLDAMLNHSYCAFLAFDGADFVGTCSVCLYATLPGKKLPNGKDAYIQNMYVLPAYRRRGIGKMLVSMAVGEALRRGHARVTLHATDAGMALFSQCGFQSGEDIGLSEMVYAPDDGK